MNRILNILYCTISFIFIILFAIASIYHAYTLFNILTAILIFTIRPVYFLLRNKINNIKSNIVTLIAMLINLYGIYILYKSITNGVTLDTNNIIRILLTVLAIIIVFIINKLINRVKIERKESGVNLNIVIILILMVINIINIFINNSSVGFISTAISIAVSLFLIYILITYNHYDVDKRNNILMFIILLDIISLNFISAILSFVLLKNLTDEKNKETIDIFNIVNKKTRNIK